MLKPSISLLIVDPQYSNLPKSMDTFFLPLLVAIAFAPKEIGLF